VAQVTRALGDRGVEWDGDGRLVGAGLSLRPTPHRMVVNGRILWAWCAFDTLLFPPLLEVSARVESPCRATGQPVSVDVTAQGVQRVDPATAVVSMLPPRELSDVRQQVCVYGHYFHSAEAAADWHARHPDGEVLPVAETFQVARRMARLFAGPPQHLV
jgi:alkylmercury lyase